MKNATMDHKYLILSFDPDSRIQQRMQQADTIRKANYIYDREVVKFGEYGVALYKKVQDNNRD